MKVFKSGRNPFRRYPGTIYRIRTARRATVDPAFLFGGARTGYVGKTRRRPYTKRIAEHRRDQPWSDLIVSHDVLWASARVSDFGLWWREIYYIVTRMPVYNYQWNRWNPRRVRRYQALIERGRRNGLRRHNGERTWI